MEGSDASRLSARLQELVAIHGKHWGIIAEIMEKEEFRDRGKPLSSNALRKRYKKLGGSEQPFEASEPESKQEQGVSDFDWLQKNRMDSALKQFGKGESGPGVSPEDAFAALIALNNQLLGQVRESNVLMQRLEKRIEESDKSSHTQHTDEQPVTSRDLLELLRELGAGRLQMMHIEEERKDYPSREEVHQLIDEIVEERVEAELKSMLTPDGSFSGELSNLVDQRLKTLFSGGEPVTKTPHAGPGRGKRGKTHKKFSASLEESLFERVKGLPGQFSGHLSNALEAYLAVMREKEGEE